MATLSLKRSGRVATASMQQAGSCGWKRRAAQLISHQDAMACGCGGFCYVSLGFCILQAGHNLFFSVNVQELPTKQCTS